MPVPSRKVLNYERPAGSPTNGGNGGGRERTEIRLARLEERLESLKENTATKLDVEGLKTWMMRWYVVGPLSAAIIALVVQALWPR